VTEIIFQTKITNTSWGSHGDDYKGNYTMGCDAAWFGR